MEKDLITIVIVILIVILAITVVYRSFSMFLKPATMPAVPQEDKQKQEAAYKKIIEESDSSYKAFMKEQKYRIKNPP